jgi:hypothetical protein
MVTRDFCEENCLGRDVIPGPTDDEAVILTIALSRWGVSFICLS